MVGGRYHCIMVRSFDFILGATAEGYAICIGTASTLHCRRAKKITIISRATHIWRVHCIDFDILYLQKNIFTTEICAEEAVSLQRLIGPPLTSL